METKLCSKCSTFKPLTDFRNIESQFPGRKYKTEHSKYYSHCKVCAAKSRRAAPSGRYSATLHNVNRKGGTQITYAEVKSLGLPEDQDCYLCGERMNKTGSELDHVIPRTQGGENRPENLRWTHKTCNRLKHDMSVAEMLDLMKKIVSNLE